MLSIKKHIKSSYTRTLVISWLLILLSSTFVYFLHIKSKQEKVLDSILTSSADLITRSLRAGDWDIPLEHLRLLSEQALIYRLEAFLPASGERIIGPLNTGNRGIFEICKNTKKKNEVAISACLHVIPEKDFFSIAVSLTTVMILYCLMFYFIRLKSNVVMNGVLSSISRISTFDIKDLSNEKLVLKNEVKEFSEIEERILSLLNKVQSQSEKEVYSEVATKVVHDLRSPVAVLNKVLNNVKFQTKNDASLFSGALERIEEMLTVLLDKKSGRSSIANTSFNNKYSIHRFLNQFINEKTSLFGSLSISHNIISTETEHIYLSLPPVDVHSILDNLFINSVEAGASMIRLESTLEGKYLVFKIIDNGPGFPDEILNAKQGSFKSIGKEMGNGIALNSTREIITTHKGSFSIINNDIGASVSIKLPYLRSEHENHILIEDDSLIRSYWEISAKESLIKFKAYSDFESFLADVKSCNPKLTVVYLDSDLDNNVRGESLIPALKDMGFSNIKMVTGYNREDLLVPDDIDVLGKNPPWSNS